MIEIMPESAGNMLAVKPNGKLTAVDYERVFIPALEKLLESHGCFRVLFNLTSGFEGWEAGAAWDDAKFALKHRNDMEKVAVVGGPKWVKWSTTIAGHLMGGEVETFSEDELAKAMEWIKA